MTFRLFSLLLAFLLHSNLLAQNHWDQVLPEKKEGGTYHVFAENVNVRKDSNVQADILTKLQPGEKVKIVKKTKVIFTQGTSKEYWYQIQTNNQTGYVWGGLIADGFTQQEKFLILIRNTGVKSKKLELKVLKENKVISSLTFEPGPVSNEDWAFKSYKGSLFSPSPGILFGFRYLVFSEIEYAQPEETIFLIDAKGKLKTFYEWFPGGCDPPSCSETWLVFPDQVLTADPTIDRKEYKSPVNTILEITRSYDTDDVTINEYSITTKLWNGKTFLEPK